MKKVISVLAAVLLMIGGPVFAASSAKIVDEDRLIEQYNNADKEGKCTFYSYEYVVGAFSAAEGLPLELKTASVQQVQSGLNPPTDGIYIVNLHTYSQKDQDFLLGVITEGYNWYKNQKEQNLPVPDWQTLIQFKFGQCMESLES